MCFKKLLFFFFNKILSYLVTKKILRFKLLNLLLTMYYINKNKLC